MPKHDETVSVKQNGTLICNGWHGMGCGNELLSSSGMLYCGNSHQIPLLDVLKAAVMRPDAGAAVVHCLAMIPGSWMKPLIQRLASPEFLGEKGMSWKGHLVVYRWFLCRMMTLADSVDPPSAKILREFIGEQVGRAYPDVGRYFDIIKPVSPSVFWEAREHVLTHLGKIAALRWTPVDYYHEATALHYALSNLNSVRLPLYEHNLLEAQEFMGSSSVEQPRVTVFFKEVLTLGNTTADPTPAFKFWVLIDPFWTKNESNQITILYVNGAEMQHMTCRMEKSEHQAILMERLQRTRERHGLEDDGAVGLRVRPTASIPEVLDEVCRLVSRLNLSLSDFYPEP